MRAGITHDTSQGSLATILFLVSIQHPHLLCLYVLFISFSVDRIISIIAKFPISHSLERIKKKSFGSKTRKRLFVMLGRLQGLVGCVVEFACRECAGCEWPSRSLDKDTPLQLICTLWRRLKRDIWKTADRCDKGGYDSSFSLAFLSSFASIPPAHSLSGSSLSVSFSTND